MTNETAPSAGLRTTLIVTFLVVGGLVGGALFFRSSMGSGVGAPCNDSLVCKPGLFCVEDVCANKCTNDEDCTLDGWTCIEVQITKQQIGIEYEAGTMHTCLPPGAAEQAIEATGIRAEMDMLNKAGIVQRALIPKAMAADPMNPQFPSNENFQTLWNAIPEQDRRTLSEDQLVDQIWTAWQSQPMEVRTP